MLQNKAARAVTRKSSFTPTRRLLEECKRLSVNQLVYYQTVLGVHKIVVAGKPEYLSKKFSSDYPYRTRQATGGGVWFGEEFHAKSSLRTAKNIETFKYKLKQWVSTNIPLD